MRQLSARTEMADSLWTNYGIKLTTDEVDDFILFSQLYYKDRQSTGDYLTDVPFHSLAYRARRNLHHIAYNMWRKYERGRG